MYSKKPDTQERQGFLEAPENFNESKRILLNLQDKL